MSLKNHFTKEKYDYHIYAGKTRATIKAFNRRIGTKNCLVKDIKQVVEFFVSNFISY